MFYTPKLSRLILSLTSRTVLKSLLVKKTIFCNCKTILSQDQLIALSYIKNNHNETFVCFVAKTVKDKLIMLQFVITCWLIHIVYIRGVNMTITTPLGLTVALKLELNIPRSLCSNRSRATACEADNPT